MALALSTFRPVCLSGQKEYNKLKRKLKDTTFGYGSVIATSYFITQGFHDIYYNNEPYELSECIVFLLMASYLIVQFFIFPGILKSSIASLFKKK